MALCPYVYAHWKLNESSGFTAYDSAPNARNGTLTNMEGNEWKAAKLNNGLEFNASGEYVNCGNIFPVGKTIPFSFEFWMKTSSSTNYIVPFSKIQYAWHGIQTFVHLSKLHVYFMASGAGQLHFSSSNVVNDGAWHHVIVTYDGSGLVSGCNIYIDNINVTYRYADTLTGDFSNTGNVQISCRFGTNNYFEGMIDEVVLYTKELTVADVAERWNGSAGTELFSGSPPNTPNTPDPTNNEIDVEYNRILTWDCTHPDGTTMTYDVYFDTNNPPVSLVSDDQAAKSYNPGPMEAYTDYYWKIVATDICGNSTAGPVWKFTTRNEDPVTPYSPSPSNLSIGNPIVGVTLTWECEDYNPGDTLTYDVYFGKSSTPPLVKSDHPTKSYALAALEYETNYYWKIVAKDNHGGTTSSPVWKFTTSSAVSADYLIFDPRKSVRNMMAVEMDINNDGIEEYVLSIVYDNSHRYKIPIYLSEEVKSDTLPKLPFIELGLLSILSSPQDICAATRKNEAIIDIHIWYTNEDDIDYMDLGKIISDKIYAHVRTYQSTVSGIHFMNVRNTGRVMVETHGRQVVYHRVMELYCLYYSEAID